MATDRQRFLPIGKHDVVDLCAADPRLPVGDRPAFRDFCRIVESVFHFEFHARLEHLKRCHAPFDPDRPAAPLCPPTDTERGHLQQDLVEGLRELLQATAPGSMASGDATCRSCPGPRC